MNKIIKNEQKNIKTKSKTLAGFQPLYWDMSWLFKFTKKPDGAHNFKLDVETIPKKECHR